MNSVVLTGRLARDPEMRQTQSGTEICSFTIAVDKQFRRRDAGDNEPTADFFRCTAFGKTGEFIGRYFQKGKLIAVSGRIENDNYEKDGVKHYSDKIIVQNAEFVGGKNESEGSRSGNDVRPQGNRSIAPAGDPDFEPLDDPDLPF